MAEDPTSGRHDLRRDGRHVVPINDGEAEVIDSWLPTPCRLLESERVAGRAPEENHTAGARVALLEPQAFGVKGHGAREIGDHEMEVVDATDA